MVLLRYIFHSTTPFLLSRFQNVSKKYFFTPLAFIECKRIWTCHVKSGMLQFIHSGEGGIRNISYNFHAMNAMRLTPLSVPIVLKPNG
jgi:hypothetical protein